MRYCLFALALLLGNPAAAQQAYNGPAVSPNSAILGSFPVASVPVCSSATQGKYAFALDLGGGADSIICDGVNWKHIRLGAPGRVSQTSGTYTVTPLTTPPILFLDGGITTLTIKISSTGIYPGYMLYVRRPGVLTGTIGVQMATGGTVFPILGNSTALFVYDGSALQQVQ